MFTNIGLYDFQRPGLTVILNTLLADQYVLAMKTRNYRWNAAGPRSSGLHDLLQMQYPVLDAMIDDVAESVRALGSATPSTLAEILTLTKLTEGPAAYSSVEAITKHLLSDHETVIRRLRDDVKRCADRFEDHAVAALLARLVHEHQRLAWRLRAQLTGAPAPARTTGVAIPKGERPPLPFRLVYSREA